MYIYIYMYIYTYIQILDLKFLIGKFQCLAQVRRFCTRVESLVSISEKKLKLEVFLVVSNLRFL